MMTDPAPTPPSCGKPPIPTEEHARYVLEHVAAWLRSTEKTKVPTRVYQCPQCHAWHLTAKPTWHWSR